MNTEIIKDTWKNDITGAELISCVILEPRFRLIFTPIHLITLEVKMNNKKLIKQAHRYTNSIQKVRDLL